MTGLRTGAIPSIQVGREDAPTVDPYEAGDRAREKAAAYAAWLNAGKTREQIEAEQRQRHAETQNRRGRDR